MLTLIVCTSSSSLALLHTHSTQHTCRHTHTRTHTHAHRHTCTHTHTHTHTQQTAHVHAHTAMIQPLCTDKLFSFLLTEPLFHSHSPGCTGSQHRNLPDNLPWLITSCLSSVNSLEALKGLQPVTVNSDNAVLFVEWWTDCWCERPECSQSVKHSVVTILAPEMWLDSCQHLRISHLSHLYLPLSFNYCVTWSF